ncbi:MAG: hypothetical protein J5621_03470 [Paludibacteraceae bacterium]|nr:hypothetical protein [Paludibacteraceae bacterium]
MERSARAARSEVFGYLGEADARIEIQGAFLQSCGFQDKHGHKLAEQFPHGIEAGEPVLHTIYRMAHSEKDRLDSSSAGSIIEFRIALGGVRDANEGGGGLQRCERILEALQTTHPMECKMFLLRQYVRGG